MPASELELESIDDMAYYQLSLTEKVQLGGALTWPCIVFAMTMPELRVYFGDSVGIELVLGLFSMFVLGPWVVRQVVGMNFANFHLAVIRHGSLDYDRAMTYKESLPVLWLITWRPSLVMLAAILASKLMLGPALELAAASVLSLILQAFWLNQAMTEKIYADFCLVIRRAGTDREKRFV